MPYTTLVKKPVFWASLITGVILIGFNAFQWKIVDAVTPFLITPIHGVIAALYFASVIFSIIFIFKNWRTLHFLSLLPFAINFLAILISARVPFTEITIDHQFKANLNQMIAVVQDVKTGELQANDRGLIHLPFRYNSLSSGGDDIVVDHTLDGRLEVLFFTFRGLIDNFAGILYKENNEPPTKEDFQCGTLLESKKFTDKWFWISCT